MKFIDLSIPIINTDEMLFDIPKTQPKILYSTHEEGAIEMSGLFMKLNPEEHFLI